MNNTLILINLLSEAKKVLSMETYIILIKLIEKNLHIIIDVGLKGDSGNIPHPYLG